MAPPLPSSVKSATSTERVAMEDEDDEERDYGGGGDDLAEFEEEALLLDSEELGENSSRSSSCNARSSADGFKCSACDFSTRSRVMLQRHERVAHLKKKFFRCVKCNYVTHVKARYTKHVKYHSMPMIKCDLCEFRTPYKWNLDRHLKNHMGGGMYKCSLCNFTAHIKQSLTVHIQNHHLSPEKARSSRRRNKVGASDEMAEAAMDADELELLRLEREADEDADATADFDVLAPSHDDAIEFEAAAADAADDDDEQRRAKTPTAVLKMTFRKRSKSPAAKSAFVHPDQLGHKNGSKHFKCSQCTFRAVCESELSHHESRAHRCNMDKEMDHSLNLYAGYRSNPYACSPTSKSHDSSYGAPASPHDYSFLPSPPVSDATATATATATPSKSGAAVKKKGAPRPIPNLIPIASVSNTGSPGSEKSVPTILKIPQFRKRSWDSMTSDAGDVSGDSANMSPILEAVGLLAKAPGAAEAAPRKKSTFLDQLAQKLAGNEEGKSAAAVPAAPVQGGVPSRTSVAPQTTSWSSRCQYCRQRCKTRADLLSHVKSCPQALAAHTAGETSLVAVTSPPLPPPPPPPALLPPPHPMENKVFVWTRADDELADDVEPVEMEADEKRPSSVAGSDISEASLVGVETAPGIGAVTGGAGSSIFNMDNGRSTVRRVYRCPQCTFWATTASRFHVHMVGHTNTKPFECSQCAYRSNWRYA